MVARKKPVAVKGTVVILNPSMMAEGHLYAAKVQGSVFKYRKQGAEIEVFEEITPPAVAECTADNPCCDRRDEYNGFASGPLKFVCPKHCRCHD